MCLHYKALSHYFVADGLLKSVGKLHSRVYRVHRHGLCQYILEKVRPGGDQW